MPNRGLYSVKLTCDLHDEFGTPLEIIPFG